MAEAQAASSAPAAPSSSSMAMNELDRQYVERVQAVRTGVAAQDKAIAKAVAEDRTLVTDFAGTVGGPFAVYGVNLDKGGQITINGQVPMVTLTKPNVIKGILVAPGLSLKPGPVVVRVGEVEFKGML